VSNNPGLQYRGGQCRKGVRKAQCNGFSQSNSLLTTLASSARAMVLVLYSSIPGPGPHDNSNTTRTSLHQQRVSTLNLSSNFERQINPYRIGQYIGAPEARKYDQDLLLRRRLPARALIGVIYRPKGASPF
jgi:hypothetical protein